MKAKINPLSRDKLVILFEFEKTKCPSRNALKFNIIDNFIFSMVPKSIQFPIPSLKHFPPN